MISGENLRALTPAPRAAPPPPAPTFDTPSTGEVHVASPVAAAAPLPISIDGTFRDLTASLPPSLQPLVDGLPHRLGLTKSSNGQFGDFVTLHPNRELPLYAAEDPSEPGGLCMPVERIERFQRAHHLSAFCWLVRDRLEDGQVVPDQPLVQVRELLRQRWIEALTGAVDDAGIARRLIDEVTDDWYRGVRAERETLSRGAMTAAVHGRTVSDKLRWISSASVAMLLDAGQPRRARLFTRAYDLFVLSLQCIDDVNDRDEDRALYGSSVPTALGCTSGALVRAAPKLAARAAGVAAEGAFNRFACWLGVFARALGAWRPEGDPLTDELESIALAGELEPAALTGELEPPAFEDARQGQAA